MPWDRMRRTPSAIEKTPVSRKLWISSEKRAISGDGSPPHGPGPRKAPGSAGSPRNRPCSGPGPGAPLERPGPRIADAHRVEAGWIPDGPRLDRLNMGLYRPGIGKYGDLVGLEWMGLVWGS